MMPGTGADAMIDLPDFGWPLGRIAGAVEKMAGMRPADGTAEVPNGAIGGSERTEPEVEATAEAPIRPSEKELTHA